MSSRVTLTNPFDLLTDENEDRTNVPAPKSKEQKPTAPTSKPAAKPAAAVTKPAASKPAPPKAEAKAPAAKPAEAKAAPKQPSGTTVPPPRDSNQNLQERDKESRPPRDKRDHPAPVGEKKRVYDRKSGTGRPQNEVKRGGQGRGNWGGEVDLKEGAEAVKEKDEKPEEKEEVEETEKPAAEGEKKEGEAAKEGEPAAPAPKQEMTYDEYLAAQKKKAPVKVDALKPRTVTDSDFSGFVPIQREEAQPLNKKEKKATEKPAPSAAATTDKKEKKETRDLASKLLKFTTHQDEKRAERKANFGSEDSYRSRPEGGDRRRNSGPRPPRNDKPTPAASAANPTPPVQEKDFPALPHGSDPVKA